MASNPYTNCAAFETADRRDRKQRDEAIARANKRYIDKRTARLEALTLEEIAIIDAAERAREAAQPHEVPDLDATDTSPPINPPQRKRP